MKNGIKDFESIVMDNIKIEPFFENRIQDVMFAQSKLRILNSCGYNLEDTIQLTEELRRYIMYLYEHIAQLEKDKQELLSRLLKEKYK